MFLEINTNCDVVFLITLSVILSVTIQSTEEASGGDGMYIQVTTSDNRLV